MIRKREADLFNMSFLDLFAAAVGAVAFIIMIIYLSSFNLVQAKANPAPETAEQKAAREALRRRADDLEREVADLRRTDPGPEAEKKASDALAAARRSLTDAKAQAESASGRETHKRLLADVDDLVKEIREHEVLGAATRARLAEAEKSAAEAEKEKAEAEERLATLQAGASAKRGKIDFRVPMVRSEAKRFPGTAVECAGKRAYTFTPQNFTCTIWYVDRTSSSQVQSFNASNKQMTEGKISLRTYRESLAGFLKNYQTSWTTGRDGISFQTRPGPPSDDGSRLWVAVMWGMKRRSDSKGETEDEVEVGASAYMKAISELDPKSNYVVFKIRPSGFGVFRECRRLLYAKGLDADWDLLSENEPLRGGLGSGGGGSTK